MTTSASTRLPEWDGIERRRPSSCRRRGERRSFRERRFDPRRETRQRRRGFFEVLRSMLKTRLGVDRRAIVDQRKTPDRRRRTPGSLLTREELADLLK